MTKQKNKYEWLAPMMPGLVKKMEEKRREYGADHVQLCWRRGVVEGLPGWFYAREGTLSIGAIDARDGEHLIRWMMQSTRPGDCMLQMRLPEERKVEHGA